MVDVPVTLPEPSKEADVQTTSPVIPTVLPVAKALAVVALPSKAATRVPVVIDKLPVSAPVKVPVPTINLSADSSQPINALFELPLSITSPASLAGVPDVPLPSSIKASFTTELVVFKVVVVPLTVKSPVTTTLLLNVLLPANVCAVVRSQKAPLPPTVITEDATALPLSPKP